MQKKLLIVSEEFFTSMNSSFYDLSLQERAQYVKDKAELLYEQLKSEDHHTVLTREGVLQIVDFNTHDLIAGTVNFTTPEMKQFSIAGFEIIEQQLKNRADLLTNRLEFYKDIKLVSQYIPGVEEELKITLSALEKIHAISGAMFENLLNLND